MTRKSKLGSDPLQEEPLSFIKDSRQGKQSKQTIRGKQKRWDSPQEGYIRATFIVKEELLEKIRAEAYWSRMEIKETIEGILEEHYKNRSIKPRPIKRGKR